MDGAGTQGVLAFRHEFDGQRSTVLFRVFYMVNGELVYTDIHAPDANMLVHVTARDNRLAHRWFVSRTWEYRVYGILDGRLTEQVHLKGRVGWAEYPEEPEVSYYYFPDGAFAGIRSEYDFLPFRVTEEEFDMLRKRYGFDNFRDWGAVDETAQIIARFSQ